MFETFEKENITTQPPTPFLSKFSLSEIRVSTYRKTKKSDMDIDQQNHNRQGFLDVLIDNLPTKSFRPFVISYI